MPKRALLDKPAVAPAASGDAPGSTGEAADWSAAAHESPVEAPKPPLAVHRQAVDAPEPSGDGSNRSEDSPDWSVEAPIMP